MPRGHAENIRDQTSPAVRRAARELLTHLANSGDGYQSDKTLCLAVSCSPDTLRKARTFLANRKRLRFAPDGRRGTHYAVTWTKPVREIRNHKMTGRYLALNRSKWGLAVVKAEHLHAVLINSNDIESLYSKSAKLKSPPHTPPISNLSKHTKETDRAYGVGPDGSEPVWSLDSDPLACTQKPHPPERWQWALVQAGAYNDHAAAYGLRNARQDNTWEREQYRCAAALLDILDTVSQSERYVLGLCKFVLDDPFWRATAYNPVGIRRNLTTIKTQYEAQRVALYRGEEPVELLSRPESRKAAEREHRGLSSHSRSIDELKSCAATAKPFLHELLVSLRGRPGNVKQDHQIEHGDNVRQCLQTSAMTGEIKQGCEDKTLRRLATSGNLHRKTAHKSFGVRTSELLVSLRERPNNARGTTAGGVLRDERRRGRVGIVPDAAGFARSISDKGWNHCAAPGGGEVGL